MLGSCIKMASGPSANIEGASTHTLATGVITVSSGLPLVRVTVAAESGTTDDFITITGLKDGQMIECVADTGDTITVKGTDNLKIPANFTLTGDRVWVGCGDGTNVREWNRGMGA